MALPQGYNPAYAYQATQAQPTNWGNIGQHAFGAVLGGLQGGLGAYGQRQNLLAQQQQTQQAQTGEMKKGQFPAPTGQLAAPMPNQTDQLSNLLQYLTSRKVDQMMEGRGGNLPTNLRQMAYQASNLPQTQQGPPQWQAGQPQFAFEQYTGPQDQYNPLAALADLSSEAFAERDVEQPWWRQAAHGIGQVASGAAPLAAALGPWGIAAGAGLGALGYLAQQV